MTSEKTNHASVCCESAWDTEAELLLSLTERVENLSVENWPCHSMTKQGEDAQLVLREKYMDQRAPALGERTKHVIAFAVRRV